MLANLKSFTTLGDYALVACPLCDDDESVPYEGTVTQRETLRGIGGALIVATCNICGCRSDVRTYTWRSAWCLRIEVDGMLIAGTLARNVDAIGYEVTIAPGNAEATFLHFDS